METIFDNPVWVWKLLPVGSTVSKPINHDVATAIVIPGDNEPEVKARVNLMPPSDAFFFLRAQGVPVDAESYFHIVIRGKRAYAHLYALEVGEDGEQPQHSDWALFYWTKSTAPGWLKKHLK